MLDIKIIRSDPKGVETRLQTKDPDVQLAPILALDEEVRHLKSAVEEIKGRRNLLSKEIGEKKRSGEDTSALMKEVSGLGDKTAEIDKQLHKKETELNDLLARLPNLPEEGAKSSQNIEDNVVLRTFGEKPSFSFEAKNHVELNEKLPLFDFKSAAKASSSH